MQYNCNGCDILVKEVGNHPPPADHLCIRCFNSFCNHLIDIGRSTDEVLNEDLASTLPVWIQQSKEKQEMCYTCNKNKSSLLKYSDGICTDCWVDFDAYKMGKLGQPAQFSIPENDSFLMEWLAERAT